MKPLEQIIPMACQAAAAVEQLYTVPAFPSPASAHSASIRMDGDERSHRIFTDAYCRSLRNYDRPNIQIQGQLRRGNDNFVRLHIRFWARGLASITRANQGWSGHDRRCRPTESDRRGFSVTNYCRSRTSEELRDGRDRDHIRASCCGTFHTARIKCRTLLGVILKEGDVRR